MMKKHYVLVLFALLVCLSCTTTPSGEGENGECSAAQRDGSLVFNEGSSFGPNEEFIGSPLDEVGRSGLFDTHQSQTCGVAFLENGEESFAARVQTLRDADMSIRIQALIFTADESGLYIAEILKKKRPREPTFASSSTDSPTLSFRPSGCILTSSSMASRWRGTNLFTCNG